MPTPTPRIVALCRALPVLCALVVSLFFAPFVSAAESKKTYSINSGPAATTLKEFAEQSGRSVLFSTEKVQGISTNAIRGELTAEEALDRLLSGTRLSAVPEKSTGGFAIRREVSIEVAEKNVSSRPANSRAAYDVQDGVVKLDTFEVFGRKTLNMDIQRTRDDVQPYVTFDRETIEMSGATNLEDFLRTRLPMNATRGSNTQTFAGASGSTLSTIDLRGLGANQTLILVDGRRIPNVNVAAAVAQPNINGLPLSAIERIEVLPSTAGGIYGGGATGGVLNIILRRDYAGVEATATYRTTTDGSNERYEFSVNAGLTLRGGRTRIMLTASERKSDALMARDRSFGLRQRQMKLLLNPDPATAVPPAGFTTNIRSVTNIPLTLDNGVALNSSFTSIPVGYAGVATDGLTPLAGRGGIYSWALPDDNSASGSLGFALLPETKDRMIGASLRSDIGKRAEGFIDFTYSVGESETPPSASALQGNQVTIPGGSPNNPFQQDIIAVFPTPFLITTPSHFTIETLRGIAGVVVRLPRDWTAGLDASWSKSTTEGESTSGPQLVTSATAAFQDGTLNVLRDLNRFPLDVSPYMLGISPITRNGPLESTSATLTARVAGRLLELPTGPLMISGYFEAREDIAKEGFTFNARNTAGAYIRINERRQEVKSAYMELTGRLFSNDSRFRFLRDNEWFGSVRADEYRTRAFAPLTANVVDPILGPYPTLTSTLSARTSVSYTTGFRWAPVPDVGIRVSGGIGFLPPAVNQISPTQSFPTSATMGQTFPADPKRGNMPGNRDAAGNVINATYTRFNGSDNLKAEDSQSLSAGLVVNPRVVPGLRASVDYTRIEKNNEIASLSDLLLLGYEDHLPGIITRGPNLPGDLPGWAGPIISWRPGFHNIAKSRVEAFDLQLDYVRETNSFGKFLLYSVATRQTHRTQKLNATAPELEFVGYSDGPQKWKGNAGITWKRGAVTVGWNMQYYASYVAYGANALPQSRAFTVTGQGAERIPGQRYHNIYTSYEWRNQKVWLNNTSLTFSVQNVFDTEPPFIFGTENGYSNYGDPRLRNISLSIRKRF